MSSNMPQPEAAPIVACTISRDVQNFDLLIEDMESALGEAWGDLGFAEALAFFDAIAPIVYADSIDMSQAWMQSRYDKGETEEERTAYLNCPMDKQQYEDFIDALLAAEKTEFREGETAGYFDGCLPIEVMAERGRGTPRHRPVKPLGLAKALP